MYNVHGKSDVNHRGMRTQCNNKLFPSLNGINGKLSTYVRKGTIRHYHYWSDPKLGPGIVAIRIIPCSCHACTTILSLSWESKLSNNLIS